MITAPDITDWNYDQMLQIESDSNEFSFVVFGDNRNSSGTFNNLISTVNREDIVFSIDDGDITLDGEREKFNFFINQIELFDKPMLTVFGNHESTDSGRAIYYEVFGQFYYSFVVGDSYFIVLDNSNEKDLDPQQYDWLKEELSISQGYKDRFVFMHVPLFDPRDIQGINFAHAMSDPDFAEELNDLFDESNVTMLFTSHIHQYYRGEWGETPYIITGGAGAELAGTDPEHSFYHYIKVNVSDSGNTYEVVKLDTPDYEIIDRLATAIWIFIYSFLVIHFVDVLLAISLAYVLSYTFIDKLDIVHDKVIHLKEKFYPHKE